MACDDYEGLPDTATYRLEGIRLFVSGTIGRPGFEEFQRLIAENPEIRTLVLMDVPGWVEEEAGLEMGYMLRARGLNTHLTSQSRVYSGGVDLFLAGVRRTIDPGGQLGVHEWAGDVFRATNFPPGAPEHRANADYTRAMLGSDDFYYFGIYAAPPDSIHIVTPAELRRFGVVNG